MPILSQPHRTLRRIAEEHGVSYKPSGAGGGDLGVGFSANPGPMDRMCCAARDVGLAPLDLEIDTTGVSLRSLL